MDKVKNVWSKVTDAYSGFDSKGKGTKVAMIVIPVVIGLVVVSLVTSVFT